MDFALAGLLYQSAPAEVVRAVLPTMTAQPVFKTHLGFYPSRYWRGDKNLGLSGVPFWGCRLCSPLFTFVHLTTNTKPLLAIYTQRKQQTMSKAPFLRLGLFKIIDHRMLKPNLTHEDAIQGLGAHAVSQRCLVFELLLQGMVK